MTATLVPVSVTIEDLEKQIAALKAQKQFKAFSLKDKFATQFRNQFNGVAKSHYKSYKKELEHSKHFAFIDGAFEVVLTKLTDETTAKTIVDEFRLCVKSKTFQGLMGLYSKYRDNLEMRNLLKFCSSLYRWKYYKLFRDQDVTNYYLNKSTFKSELKYASACEKCGELAFNAAILFKQIGLLNDL